jgi:hypothetical protein
MTFSAIETLVRTLVGADRDAAPSAALLAKIAVDEAVCAVRRVRMQAATRTDWRRIAEEVSAAAELFAGAGWVDAPARYHCTPPSLERVRIRRARSFGLDFQHLSFASGYQPHDAEPGAVRWGGYTANRTAHAWVLRHRGRPRPWLVCIPGYGMGAPFVDLAAFDAPWLYRDLGLNVLIPVLPFHGPRKFGWASGDGFFSGDCLDTVHAEAQAIWDLRRMLGWLRAHGASTVGIYGLSLGGYTAALLGAFDGELACIIAGIPPADFVRLARHHTPLAMQRDAERLGFDWDQAAAVFRVVSPLALSPRLPRARRYLFAGTVDRIVPPAHVRDLWAHWEQPRTVWYDGSHLSFHWEPAVRTLLRDTLQTTLCGDARAARRGAAEAA